MNARRRRKSAMQSKKPKIRKSSSPDFSGACVRARKQRRTSRCGNAGFARHSANQTRHNQRQFRQSVFAEKFPGDENLRRCLWRYDEFAACRRPRFGRRNKFYRKTSDFDFRKLSAWNGFEFAKVKQNSTNSFLLWLFQKQI